jgi:uncharacterized protein involved in exopolysaccharide biosynthesis
MTEKNYQDSDYDAQKRRDNDAISLLDLIAVVTKRKRLIIGMTVVVVVFVVGFLAISALLPSNSRWNRLPTKYMPSAKVLIQDNSSGSSISSLLGQGGLGSLSGLLGSASFANVSSSAQLAQALLRGRTIEDAVAEKLNFIERYHIQKNPKMGVRTIIQQSLRLKYSDKTGILEIGYEDIDKELATQVVNELTDRLQDQFTDLTLGKVLNKRMYLEKAIANQQKDADSASDRLTAFQNANGVYDLPAQTQANISALGGLESQFTSKQTDLDLMRKYTPESDTRITMLKDQINQVQRQIDQLRTGAGNARTGVLSLSKMVGLSSEYASLKADVQVQQAILLTLKQQYEAAKLQQQDTSPTFQILERAEVPEVRSSPSRTKIAVIGSFLGFFVSVLVAFVVEYFDKSRRDPIGAEKLSNIRRNMAIRRKSTRE